MPTSKQKRKVIADKYLPVRYPHGLAALGLVLCQQFSVPPFVFGIVACLIVLQYLLTWCVKHAEEPAQDKLPTGD